MLQCIKYSTPFGQKEQVRRLAKGHITRVINYVAPNFSLMQTNVADRPLELDSHFVIPLSVQIIKKEARTRHTCRN